MVITGIYYAAGLVAGGLLLAWLTRPWIAAPLFLLAAFCLWFFRDPERRTPPGPHAVAPADGRIVRIVREGPFLRLSVFLSPLDVHVNRAPVAGRIETVEYRPGRFLVASRDEASAVNEQNVITLRTPEGISLTLRQIAGVVARRVVCFKRAGDHVRMGERIGLMKFGSRMDVLFGPEWDVVANENQRVRAGETVIARRKTA